MLPRTDRDLCGGKVRQFGRMKTGWCQGACTVHVQNQAGMLMRAHADNAYMYACKQVKRACAHVSYVAEANMIFETESFVDGNRIILELIHHTFNKINIRLIVLAIESP